ncbi:hypothetical protein [Streptomyces sp. NPDC001508]|uniref:hypothetical protein n=1 Tax=Streptomyces sp. NPDC001508 TaxID=3154656 RepID=UPI003317B7A3
MRIRIATTALGLTAAVLALPACSDRSGEANPASPSTARVGHHAGTGGETTALSAAELEARLLDENNLGTGYERKPQSTVRHADVTVLGCPALDELGGEAATGGSLDFPRKATASFTSRSGNGSEVSAWIHRVKVGLGTGKWEEVPADLG